MRRESGKPASAVTLVPMGRLPPELLRWLQERLHETLRRPVSVGKPVGLPPAAYHAQRQQYIGEAILAALRPLPLPPGTPAVALVHGRRDCLHVLLAFAEEDVVADADGLGSEADHVGRLADRLAMGDLALALVKILHCKAKHVARRCKGKARAR